MNEERSIDRLARYVMWAAGACIIGGLCWYFRSVLIYIIMAAVVSLLARPLKRFLGRAKVKGKSAPEWLLSMLSLILIILIFLGIVTQVIPVVGSIIHSVSTNLNTASFSASVIAQWVDKANLWLIDRIPQLGRDFKLQDSLIQWISDTFNLSSVTSVVGSVASLLGSFGIALFSIVFIGFFFVKDENLFRRIVGSLVPDSYEKDVINAVGDIEHLLTRYFVGLLTEVLGVALLNFLGLWIVAKVGFYPAVGIAFMTGLLNVIPYVGPWIGAAIGTSLGIVIKYSSAAVIGVYPSFWVVLATLLAVFVVTQMVDNFLFQPFIYSTSIKSSPLEIFIVLLMAGHVGGIMGMLAAIPAYTVIRVVAARFFSEVKPIKRLVAATSSDDSHSSEEKTED